MLLGCAVFKVLESWEMQGLAFQKEFCACEGPVAGPETLLLWEEAGSKST
jgi:hypothetical protein